ncbi:MAG TPA: kelch repeat-containing protein, partial [Burkholderiaceae bacterium]|nr:kelch repeat-containing protein [Burkholderiaceae bacterium]
NGAIYLSGGTLASGTARVLSAAVRTFTPASGTWVQVGNHPAGRTNHALIAASGKLFAVGGNMIINTVLGGTLATESATVPATPAEGISFKQSAALNQIATSATAVTIGGKVYMFSNSPVYILTPELDVL